MVIMLFHQREKVNSRIFDNDATSTTMSNTININVFTSALNVLLFWTKFRNYVSFSLKQQYYRTILRMSLNYRFKKNKTNK